MPLLVQWRLVERQLIEWQRRCAMALIAMCLAIIGTAPATNADEQAAQRLLRVVLDPSLAQSDLAEWLAPRFRFKTGITLVAAASDAPLQAGDAADLALLPADEAEEAEAATPIAAREETTYVAVVLGSGDTETANARKLVSWLVSKAGQRAIQRFEPAEGPRFREPGAVTPVETAAVASAVTAKGEKLSLQHCGRCHVVSEKNKYGGIGSTPSFPALRTFTDYREKFDAFWTLNPHPSFTQVAGITPPFDPNRPPHIAPVELTLEDVEAITAFVVQMTPKDLGAAVQAQ
ncbi:MAG: cytochrome c [Pseudomonadota bacterium]